MNNQFIAYPLPLRRQVLSLIALVIVLALMTPFDARADETEIFRSSIDTSGSRPRVLIIFDDSGSMSDSITSKPEYDPSVTYTPVSGIQAGRVYWATGSTGSVPSRTTSNWFDASRNRCASSYTPLSEQGMYVDNMGRARQRNNGRWEWLTLSNEAQTPPHIDCKADISGLNASNPGAGGTPPGNGYPVNGVTQPYQAVADRAVNFTQPYRLYSANYMNYWYGVPSVTRTKLNIAKDVIKGIVQTSPGIDFGLMTFNRNTSSSTNGGRVIRRVIPGGTDADRTALSTMITGLTANGNTPLCESMFEAYNYVAGNSVLYGTQRDASFDSPAKDNAAESPSGTYASPAGGCQYVYIILMTDGLPTQDTDANSRIRTLIGRSAACPLYDVDNSSTDVENCMPLLAEFMYSQDFDKNSNNGIQKAITFTIGFDTDQRLLEDTANLGGGKYYTANNSEELTSAFQGAISEILSISSSFTSPAVAVDSFSRTQSLDSVFLAMFLPRTTVDWPGNIKKFRVSVNSAGVATYVDKNGNAALDTTTGQLKTTAVSFWGDAADGADVKKGGVGDLLLARAPDTRVIKFNSAAGNLLDFTTSNVTAANIGVADSAALFGAFGVSDQADLNNLLAWVRGWTDSSKATKREWMMGDILNSRPVAINYGARGGYTKANPDLRLLVGTNAGLLHMFSGDTGAESWAFAPKELAALHALRREDAESADTLYGVDAPPVIYRLDANNDGSIQTGGNDKVYAYVGLRRGGRALYALNLTDPDNPSFMWKIDQDTAGMSELGQTWSSPTVSRIKGYANPVLILGGGYDSAYDDKSTLASGVAPDMGRGVFVVDAVTGGLLWSATPAANSAKNKQVLSFVHSMAAAPTVMDSNGDGYADRIYIPDVGGNVWRIDMAGVGIPSGDHTNWRVLQMASLAEANHAGDRRFFSAIEVARALESAKPFDALMLGSGDRTNPNAIDNSDRFYMIRDYMAGVYTTDRPNAAACTSNPTSDPRCQLPVTNSTLYNASANLIQVGSEAQKVAAKNALGAAAGWYVNLTAASGEKSLATSRTISGTVYFPTFSPGGSALNANQCVPAAGTGRLYAVNIFDASAKLDFDGSNTLTLSDRSVVTGSMISDTPSIYAGSDRVIQLILPPGSVPTTGTIFREGSQSTGRRLGLQTRVPFVPTETYAPGQESGRYWYMPDRR